VEGKAAREYGTGRVREGWERRRRDGGNRGKGIGDRVNLALVLLSITQ